MTVLYTHRHSRNRFAGSQQIPSLPHIPEAAGVFAFQPDKCTHISKLICNLNIVCSLWHAICWFPSRAHNINKYIYTYILIIYNLSYIAYVWFICIYMFECTCTKRRRTLLYTSTICFKTACDHSHRCINQSSLKEIIT